MMVNEEELIIFDNKEMDAHITFHPLSIVMLYSMVIFHLTLLSPICHWEDIEIYMYCQYQGGYSGISEVFVIRPSLL